jgi:hypothetical protein
MTTMQHVAITLDEAAINLLAQLLATASNEKSDEEKKREARLQASRNAPFAGRSHRKTRADSSTRGRRHGS